MRALVRSTSMLSAKAVAAVLVVVSLTLAGCSSEDQTPNSSSTSSESSTESSASSSMSSSASESTTSASESPSATASESVAPPASTTSASVTPTTTSDVPPPPTTEVPAQGGGDINQTVPPVELTTAPPVELTQTAQFGGGVAVDLSSIVRQQIEAQGPGEISGPGLVVTIKITNSSAAAINLDAVNVTLEDGNLTPGSPMSGSPYNPFTGDLAAGASASGVYVFSLPTDYANPSKISVSYSTSADIVVFSGNAP